MAKIKVKGQMEQILVPDDQAKAVSAQIDAKTIEMDKFIHIGRFYGRPRDITNFVFEEEGAVNTDNSYFNYLRERNDKLKLSLEDRVKMQKNLYSLTCRLFNIEPSIEQKRSDVEKTKKFLLEHPYRVWCDIGIWIAGWDISGNFKDEYNQGAIRTLEMVMKTDMVEEQAELEKIGVLTSETD